MGPGAGRGWSRRAFCGLLGAGLAAHLSSCATATVDPVLSPLTNSSSGDRPLAAASAPSQDGLATPPPTDSSTRPGASAGTAPADARPVVLAQGPPDASKIALTIDDGYADDVVAGYVALAQRTGVHLTFSPNASYSHAWSPHAPVLRPLIETGQVQIMNHTVNHPDLTAVPASRVRRELEANEQWVNQTFATSTRPYYRPPYGAHNMTVDRLAAGVGFNRVVLWNGSYGDSSVVTPQYLMSQARRYLNPGVILLGHANHPTVLGLFDQLQSLIRDRHLQPVTLDEMFGTRRPPITPN